MKKFQNEERQVPHEQSQKNQIDEACLNFLNKQQI